MEANEKPHEANLMGQLQTTLLLIAAAIGY